MNNYINSRVIIAEMFEDYNIQSSDFITRFPVWVIQCLEDLNIIQAYVNKEIENEYNNGKFQLPYDCKGVISIKINNELYKPVNNINGIVNTNVGTASTEIFRFDLYEDAMLVDENSDVQAEWSHYRYDHNVSIGRTVRNCKTVYVNGNWVNVKDPLNGIYIIRYRGFPLEYSNDDGTYYPLIYNEEVLKQAIKYYIIKNMLIRGYVHPVMNLKENNPYINPAMAYDKIRIRTRNKCNKFSSTRRNDIVTLNTSTII
jgi:hypothetical protein